jgi:NADH-quinone oxidoreductase subunit H
LSGWVSGSRYAVLGSIRASAQMISYEIPLTLSVVPVIFNSGSCNFFDIVYQQLQI